MNEPNNKRGTERSDSMGDIKVFFIAQCAKDSIFHHFSLEEFVAQKQIFPFATNKTSTTRQQRVTHLCASSHGLQEESPCVYSSVVWFV